MRKKKEYQVNDTLNLRLTEKAGTTVDVLEWLNNQEKLTSEVLKALKFWIRYQEGQATERLRFMIEQETERMEQSCSHYGENRGPYKKAKK